jgi:signal transduction histidine kinase/ABC-type amino acid transport substrate-binding protein
MNKCPEIKRVGKHFIYPLFLCCILSGIYAADSPNKKVRVGMFPFDGYYHVDADGTRTGYGYTLLQLMAQHADLSYEYIDNIADWSTMEKMLENGEIDMLTCVQKNAESRKRFAFSDTPIGTSATMFTVKSGNTEITGDVFSTYKGKTIGVIKNNSHASKFSAYAEKNNFTYIQKQYDSLDLLENALQKGDIDGCVTSSLRPLRNEWILDFIDPSPFYLMMRKNDDVLCSMVNDALDQLTVSTPNWRTDLYNQFYSPTGADELYLTAAERDFIKANASVVFKVAVCPDNEPYSYFEDGKAKGIIPEVFNEIARRAGIQYTVVNCGTHHDYERIVSGKTVNLIMDAGWDLSTAENKGYKLSNSYLNVPIAELRKNSRKGPVTKIAVQEGPLEQYIAHNTLFSKYAFTAYPSSEETIRAAATGKCDAALVYAEVAQEYLSEHARNNLHISILSSMALPFSVGCSFNDNYLLLSVLSKSAESVKSNYVQNALLSHINSHKIKLSLVDYLYLNPQWALSVFAALFILIILTAMVVYQKKIFHKQQQFNTKLATAKLEADKANEAKSRFLSSMSHDIRTPLNGIVGFTDIALREPDVHKKQEYLQKIKLSGDLLINLVNDTLELSRIESGKIKLDQQNIDSDELVKQVLTSVTTLAEQKGVHLVTDTESFTHGTVFTDRLKFQEIALNLLSNAVKYTPGGGTVRFTLMQIEPPHNGMTCRMLVEDNGIGMSEEFLDHVYEPFAQEKRPESSGIQGTGLGLSIVKRIIDVFKGTIAVESRIHEGTKFTVELPVIRSECSREKTDTVQSAELGGKKIL